MKQVTPRSEAYLDFIRAQACIGICAQPLYNQNGPNHHSIEAAHVRIGNGGGMGLKPSDFRAVPLCHLCHLVQHQHGEASFWSELNKDPDVICISLMGEWLAKQGKGKEALGVLEEICGDL